MMLAQVFLALLLHPLHTTHTTITLGPGTRCLVEIRAFTDDLQAATRRHGRVVTDSTTADYVRSTVVLIDHTGQVVPLRWLRQEPDGEVTRLTLACILPQGARGISVRQSMQVELFADQVNVVQVRAPARRTNLLFTPGDKAKPVT
jgi:hypothetical protein